MGIVESSLLPQQVVDVAIIGAGPVGLALAIETARFGLETLLVDRRPPPTDDTRLRPQLLVAREGDLANLGHLGVDFRDPQIVSLLATRCEGDLSSGRTVRGRVQTFSYAPARTDLWTLASQPPLALVAIGRLQQALLERAVRLGVRVHYCWDVTRVRRHARFASLQCAGGQSVRAALVVIATGAARSLAKTLVRDEVALPAQRMIAGLLATAGKQAEWIRVEVPVPGLAELARATVLQTSEASAAGTGVLVQVPSERSDAQLSAAFEVAMREHGLTGVPFVVEPQVFDTAVTAINRRTIAGDARAPIVIAGDAAQTGHVFSGQTCFINLALALGLGTELRHARTAIVERKFGDAALLSALERYEKRSQTGAWLLYRASQRHYAAHARGAWALAGVAQAEVWAGRAIRLDRPFVFFARWRVTIVRPLPSVFDRAPNTFDLRSVGDERLHRPETHAHPAHDRPHGRAAKRGAAHRARGQRRRVECARYRAAYLPRSGIRPGRGYAAREACRHRRGRDAEAARRGGTSDGAG